MMQMFMNVPAMSRDVYSSFGSSSRSVIRFAAACCFVFSILTSLLLSENSATSAPETIKLSSSNANSATAMRVVPWGVAVSKKKEIYFERPAKSRGLSKGCCFFKNESERQVVAPAFSDFEHKFKR